MFSIARVAELGMGEICTPFVKLSVYRGDTGSKRVCYGVVFVRCFMAVAVCGEE